MGKISREEFDKYLSSYFHAEKKGSELIARLTDFAPREEEKEWINIWSKEEGLHHRLWASVAANRRFEPREMDQNLHRLFEITEEYVNNKNWAGAMVGAALIEHLSNAAAQYLYHDADDDMKRVFRKITADDLGHLDFDIHQIWKVSQTKEGRKEILEIHKRFLAEILDWPLREGTTDIDIDILNETFQLHRKAMKKIGINLPDIHFSKSYSFKIKRGLIKFLI